MLQNAARRSDEIQHDRSLGFKAANIYEASMFYANIVSYTEEYCLVT